MNGNRKGSKFEREICVQLSEWWSKGIEGVARDDIFWRASQSGGRATQRAKSGKRTAGSYGDIAAVDAVGVPLLKVFTLELKRGRSHGDIGDMLDVPLKGKPRPFQNTLEQTIGSHQLAGSLSWLLISQRDRRCCLAIMDWAFMASHFGYTEIDFPKVHLRRRAAGIVTYMPFKVFLKKITPSQIIKLAVKNKL